MANFSNQHTAKLDDKGRLVFPAAFKAHAAISADNSFVVQIHAFEKCLEIFPIDEWNKRTEETYNKLDLDNPKDNQYWNYYNHISAEVTLDEKTGRVLIPKRLLDAVGVDKDVVFVGMHYTIYLWAKDKYEESLMSHDEFASMRQTFKKNKP